MEIQNLSSIIRFHRKKAKLTQKELGFLAGVGKTAVFDVEKEKQTIRLDTLLKILHVLNIKIEFQSPLMNLYREGQNEES